MDIITDERIKSLLDEANSLQERDYQDYSDLRDLYYKYYAINQLLSTAILQRMPEKGKDIVDQHIMLKENPMLVPLDKLHIVVQECVEHNNSMLEILGTEEYKLVNVDKRRFTPEKNVDTVEVLKMCYSNVNSVLKAMALGMQVPDEFVYSDVDIDGLSVPDLYQLYVALKEANAYLDNLLKQ